MIIASRTQFHVERPWGQHPFAKEKALVGAFSVIMNLRMELFEALIVMVLVMLIVIPAT